MRELGQKKILINLAQLDHLNRIHNNRISCLGSDWFLKGIGMKYLLHLGVIGFAFSALVGCGESAQDKATREAGEAIQKAGAAAEKAINSMKK